MTALPVPHSRARSFSLIAIFVFVNLYLVACEEILRESPTPTFTPQEVEGKDVFSSYCSNCHETGNDSVMVGPSLSGLATRASERVPGMDARTYTTQSILEPSTYVVEGFPDGLMPHKLAEELPKEDVEAVVAYLLTLR